MIARAHEVYDNFCGPGSDKAMICLGSMKSNPVAELILAEAFGCEPFVPDDRYWRATTEGAPSSSAIVPMILIPLPARAVCR